jgi:hypothetical protein
VKTELTEVEKKAFDALLAESNQIATGMRGIQDAQRRMIGLLPPVLAVGLPLLLKASTDVPEGLATTIFLGLGAMFLCFAANYIGLTRHILLLSRYHMDYLAPQLNQIIEAPRSKVFQWERFVREHGRVPRKELVGYVLIHGAEFLLLLSPSFACYGVGVYYLFDSGRVAVLVACVVAYAITLSVMLYFAWLTVQQSRKVTSEFYPPSSRR